MSKNWQTYNAHSVINFHGMVKYDANENNIFEMPLNKSLIIIDFR